MIDKCLPLFGRQDESLLSAKRISILSIDKAGALKQLLVFEIFVIRSIGKEDDKNMPHLICSVPLSMV